jgi:hypothetical protein
MNLSFFLLSFSTLAENWKFVLGGPGCGEIRIWSWTNDSGPSTNSLEKENLEIASIILIFELFLLFTKML